MIPRLVVVIAAALCLAGPAGAMGVWGGLPDPALGHVLSASGPSLSIVPEVSAARAHESAPGEGEEPGGPVALSVALVPQATVGLLVAFALIGLVTWAGGRRISQQGALRGRRV